MLGETLYVIITVNPLMPGDSKKSYVPKTNLQVLSTYDLLLPPDIKGFHVH